MTQRTPMVGRRFVRLTILSEVETIRGKLTWRCRCDCGETVIARGESLRSGNTKSCGCLQREKVADARRTHGKSRSRTHRIWCGIITRCTNQNHHSYARYGARGIAICERWRSFDAFLADMGECPDGLTIDRINNDQGYHPGNCRWATAGDQVRNTSRTNLITFGGETLCLTDWAKRLGIVNSSLRRRLRAWPLEKALKAPAAR